MILIALTVVAVVLLPLLALGIVCWAIASRDIAVDLSGSLE